MLIEIGVMIGLFILVKLIPQKWILLLRITTIITAIFTIGVIIDLAINSIADKTTFPSLRSSQIEQRDSIKIVEKAIDVPQTNAITVTYVDGGSITTHLGYGISVAGGSSIHREWISVHDSRLPIKLEGTPGVKTYYQDRSYGGDYIYKSNFNLIALESITAIEINFLLFDIWGNHVKSLSLTEVVDISQGTPKSFTGEWSALSENEVEKYYASISYISKVRIKDGKVLEAEKSPIVKEALKFSSKFTEADLESKLK